MLTYNVKLAKIKEKAEVDKEQKQKKEEQAAMLEIRKNEEPKALAKYLDDNKINVKPTASGLYFIEIKKGSGPKMKEGDEAMVDYVGSLLSGSVFDTSKEGVAKESGIYNDQRPYEPIAVKLGSHQVIPAWEEALSLMSVGSKAKIILPSNMGYGEMGNGPIPPYSPLVFEMEVLKVVK
jgi:FKBP-type peptidyl-prolyl cis-trans isomerase